MCACVTDIYNAKYLRHPLGWKKGKQQRRVTSRVFVALKPEYVVGDGVCECEKMPQVRT
jgi:hypothetical protein